MIRRVWRPSSRWHFGIRYHNSDGQQLRKAAATSIHSSASNATDNLSYRQQLKLQAKRRKQDELESLSSDVDSGGRVDEAAWELTVGIEIHAQLDAERKLFSTAATSNTSDPNSSVALCDLAYPGAQPVFQIATLLPALRAAIAFNCDIQKRSSFDRKHYFYPDQPAGYQITQFYEPFAKDGRVTLRANDGISPEDGESVTVGIRQIQLEQDTGKSFIQSGSSTLLDFNRVSHPLIEIISMPDIHHPSTAAAYVRKVQSVLKGIGAVTAGMEMGGLRADVNVSVRRRGQHSTTATQSYYGIEKLGQRTEIKNLSSFKAIEDAIIAEKRRQILILQQGGTVEGETRGWTLGGTETHKLRDKEGEVDYRYMPDPDLGPLIIPTQLIQNLEKTMPWLPDHILRLLTAEFGLTEKDARTLMSFDDGDRVEYFFEVVNQVSKADEDKARVGKLVGNWILHELGSLLTKYETSWNSDVVHPQKLAEILNLLQEKQITSSSAKQLLADVFRDKSATVKEIANATGLLSSEVPDEEYQIVVRQVAQANPKLVDDILQKGKKGKIMGLVGMVLRELNKPGRSGSVRPERVQQFVEEELRKM